MNRLTKCTHHPRRLRRAVDCCRPRDRGLHLRRTPDREGVSAPTVSAAAAPYARRRPRASAAARIARPPALGSLVACAGARRMDAPELKPCPFCGERVEMSDCTDTSQRHAHG